MTAAQLRLNLAQSLVVGLPGPRPTPQDLELVGSQGLGGVILFGRNYQSPQQIWRLCRDLQQAAALAGRPPLFIMVDQEGGPVARLKAPYTDGPDLASLGGEPAPALYQHGRRMGLELVASGINFNLAPVLDVHALADGVMARRSLGGDAVRVGELGAAYIQGLQSTGCLACGKHFPGLGRTNLDTHLARPLVELSRADLEVVELSPFRRAVEAGVAGLMVGHATYQALDPRRPASLSPLIIKGLLRGGLGYDGLALSDDLEMGALAADLSPAQAAIRAYDAGCGLLLICHQTPAALEALDALTELALRGDIPPARIQTESRRLARAKAALSHDVPPLDALEALLEKA